MRKKLAFYSWFNNAKGAIFPYIVFITTLVLMLTTTSINAYKNHLQMTNLELEYIRLDTLYQMGYAQFMEEIDHMQLNEPGQLSYYYPYGTVMIQYEPTNDDKLIIKIYISSSQGGKKNRIKTISLNDK